MWAVGVTACGQEDDGAPEPERAPARAPAPRRIAQLAPPLDVKAPPADATRTASGLAYKKLVVDARGAAPGHGEAAVVHYTGWRRSTGQTFFTTRGVGRPIAIDVAHAVAGFREVLPLLRRGERAMVWMPDSPRSIDGLVYEIEVVDIQKSVAARSR